VSTPGNPTIQQDDFYDAAPLEPHLLYQGEILADVPFLNMPKESRWQLLRTRSGKMLDEALEHGNVGGIVKALDSNQSKEQWYTATEGDFAIARLSKRPVLVLSQTCDVQTKDFIQIAPIYDADGTDEELDGLKKGHLFSAFYLKQHRPELPTESYADFELIQAVHKSYIKPISAKQHFRLKPPHVRELQKQITRYFGRPNSFDVENDKTPRTGRYLCVQCFYLTGIVTHQDRNEGDAFEACQVCHGERWVFKEG
jgi:hypothetical protein